VLFDGFLVEAKWLATDQVPSADEYLRNGVITSGVPLAFVHILFLLGYHHAASGNATELSDSIPPAITSLSKILRLWDDMGSAKVYSRWAHMRHVGAHRLRN
jgi:(3S)-linalool synthase